jgi:hypothetical protein
MKSDKRATSALVARWVKIADLDHDQTISKKELQIVQQVTAGEIAAQIKSAAVCTTVFSGLALASAYGYQVRECYACGVNVRGVNVNVHGVVWVWVWV